MLRWSGKHPLTGIKAVAARCGCDVHNTDRSAQQHSTDGAGAGCNLSYHW
jgi:hypothetical protein